MQSHSHSLLRHGSLASAKKFAAATIFAGLILPGAAQAKSLVDYFQPTPLACPPTTNTWGASTSVPRDTCNGLEDTKKPPQWVYWDGRILKAPDGKYHLLGSRWAGAAGHGGWYSSVAIHAVSDSSPLGPYVDKGVAYTNGPDGGDRSKGHNVSAYELLDGTYALIVSETVPFTIFTAKSLDGPWTNKGHAQIDRNNVQINIPFPGDQNLESNVSLVVRPDGDFEIIQRHGIIALSTTGITGPYKVQKPTTKYAPDETPPSNLPTVYPNRKKHLDPLFTQAPESVYVYAEDALIWYSGGLYHVVYDYPDDRVGYHLTSPDGIHDWTDRGLAYDPRMAKQLFSNTDGTVVSWNKMERPNVLIENGHITHFTFAVTDVDKGQISGGSNHGNKVVVMAFDGVAFDAEMGGGSAGAGGAGGGGGAAGNGGRDAGAADVTGRDAGAAGADGGNLDAAAGSGGTSTNGGSGGSGGTAGNTATGGRSGAAGKGGADPSGGASGAGGAGGGGALGPTGGARGGSDGNASVSTSSGCSCAISGAQSTGAFAPMALLAWLTAVRLRKPRRR